MNRFKELHGNCLNFGQLKSTFHAWTSNNEFSDFPSLFQWFMMKIFHNDRSSCSTDFMHFALNFLCSSELHQPSCHVLHISIKFPLIFIRFSPRIIEFHHHFFKVPWFTLCFRESHLWSDWTWRRTLVKFWWSHCQTNHSSWVQCVASDGRPRLELGSMNTRINLEWSKAEVCYELLDFHSLRVV